MSGRPGLSGTKRPRAEVNKIGNKFKRAEVLARHRLEESKEKRARRDDRRMLREEMGSAAPPKEASRLVVETL